jgi:hypothetical protein
MYFASSIIILLINWFYDTVFLGVNFGGYSVHVLCPFQASESVGFIYKYIEVASLHDCRRRVDLLNSLVI